MKAEQPRHSGLIDDVTVQGIGKDAGEPIKVLAEDFGLPKASGLFGG
jgi:hypothetical protein